jgi:hypothetical protein
MVDVAFPTPTPVKAVMLAEPAVVFAVAATAPEA